ncbi:MAG: cytochrome c biogenesis protein CcsA [Alphaproteobacteria bacterium]
MIALLGEVTLWLASLLAFAVLLTPHPWVWRVQSVMPSVCYVILLTAFALSDVSVALVAESGALGDHLLFRLASSWANHQGSLLLWWSMIGAVGFLMLRKGDFPPAFQHQAHRCHALVGFLMGTYLLFTGSPFAPSEGGMPLGLNPLLHDQGLLIHPPILFAGYALTALVSIVACGLLTQPFPVTPTLMRLWRITIALAWSVLGIGIGLGAWWAYRELGWGGWWFWDPVENASLLPWLVLTALLHAAPQAKTRQTFYRCALVYAFLAWTLCWLGTFLVRSGLLISVHSFVSDTFRGFLLLVMLMIHTVFVGVMWRRSPLIPVQDPPVALGSRPFLMGMQNYLVLGTAALVALGLFYPFVALFLFQDALSVGAGFYTQTVLPLMALSVGVLVFLPNGITFWTVPTLVITLILAVILAIVLPLSGWAQVWALLPASLLVSVLAEARRVKMARTLGHLAMPLFAIAILGYGYGQKDAVLDLKTNTPVLFQGETMILRRVFTQDFPLYTAILAEVDRIRDNRQSTLVLSRRHYKARKTVTSEMTLTRTLWQDQGYLLAGVSEDGQRLSLRVHIRPGMTLLWVSFAMMGLGGLAAAWRQR